MMMEDLLHQLRDGESLPKHTTLVQLSGLSDSEVMLLSDWWGALDSDIRLVIVQRLVSMAEENLDLDFVPIFKFCLNDVSPGVREQAIAGFWEREDRNLITPLLHLLQTDPDAKVRASAATALGEFAILAQDCKLLSRDAHRIEELLIFVIESKKEPVSVRRRALESVSSFNTLKTHELIRLAYNGEESLFRVSSLYAMGRTGDSVWLPILLEELKSDDPAIRFEAVSACGELEEEEAVPYLTAMVEDDDIQVQLSSIRSLGKIGGSLADRTLQRCYKSEIEVISDAAHNALQQLDGESDPLRFKYKL